VEFEMKKLLLGTLYFFLYLGCASTSNSTKTEATFTQPSQVAVTESGAGLSLLEAIEQSAEKIVGELPLGSRVAIAAFESANDNLSDFIMEEITGALFDRGIEVADRQNLGYVYKELGFQMSGDVSDETAQSVGKFLAAELVIVGQLTYVGNSYRFRFSAIHVEKATRDSVTRLTVRNDQEMQSMVTALANQTTTVKVAKYGVSDQVTPKTAGTYLDRGILFASRGDYELAILDFTEALNINPELSAAYLLRGRAISASVSFVIGIEKDFSGFDSYFSRGIISKEHTVIYEKAIEDFNQALRLDPNNANIYAERGFAYSEIRDYDKAIADFTQAIKLSPNDSRIYYNARGSMYGSKGDFDKAIADYTQAIRLDPNTTRAYYNRGNEYLFNGDFDKAIADFTQAIRLDPDDYDSYLNRGIAYSNKGDIDKAITDYTQAIKLNPDNDNAYTSRGVAYGIKGDYNKAVSDFTQAIRLKPNDYSAYMNRAKAYTFLNDHDKIIADYTQALKLNPDERSNSTIIPHGGGISDIVGIYYNCGMAYYNKGDINRAVADWEAVLRIDPNMTEARQNIEAVRQQRGR
jgi:tetratricopeptide (TPR) repeat protein